MKHEDFPSIELDLVLSRALEFVQFKTDARMTYWISAHGLELVKQNIFLTSEVVDQHWRFHPKMPGAGLDLELLVHVVAHLSGGEQVNAGQLRPLRMEGDRPRYVYPVVYGRRFLGAFILEDPGLTDMAKLESALKPGLTLAAKYIKFAYEYLAARRESFVDEVTGLFNQRYLPIALNHEIGRSGRDQKPFTLLFMDIDYFKRVNDGRGHWVGTRVLAEMAKVLKTQVRTYDYCFRYGGDEFIVLLAQATPEHGRTVAERIRRAIESKVFEIEGSQINLTVSIGLAGFPGHAQNAAGLIQIADQAMYDGKRTSRNIVFVAS